MLKKILHYSDVGVALLMVLVVVMMVIPLPTWLIDILLSTNITLGVVVLLVTFYVKRALDLSVFPTLLLIVTLFRIALNVSTTRLILLNGYAGEIIMAFGNFVVGGNYIVGVVIFLILVIIQLLVITKGAERVAEVAARFTLDAMPGKQMAIDADLNSGLIDDQEARARRRDIQREADFYGAMDGASKFVKGDAIAGLIITTINIVGGLSIGVFQRGMPAGRAATLYSLMTVGDGLVSQIPALLFSTATGVIVTRAAAASDLGQDIVTAFTKYPRPLYIGSGLLFSLAFLPGLPTVPFVILGSLMGGLGYMVAREGTAQEIEGEGPRSGTAAQPSGAGMPPPGAPQAGSEARPAPASPEDVMRLLTVEPMEAEIGYAIIPLVDPAQGGDMLERIGTIRKQMAVELGVVVPPIRIRDNIQIKPTEYVLRVKGAEAGRGELLPDHYLAMNTGGVEEELIGIPTTEPAFGLPALWISPDLRDKAEAMGYTVVDAPSVLATHLSEVIRRNGADLLTRQEVQKLTDMVKESAPAVVEELLGSLSLGEIQKVLQNLIREQVPIRDLVTIFEALADYGKLSRSVDFLTERARESLSRLISLKIQGADGVVTAATLSPNWEQKIMASVDGDLARGWQLNMDPREVQRMIAAISRAVDEMLVKNQAPVLLVHPNVRLIVRRLIEGSIANVFVVSYNEIAHGVQIKTVGMVE
ncbi:MAG: flagellar biosynthesis protein FlhA [Fretibacterium sp.]|uniref:flagellar biosynthesis protein FlhA n=1 Tax=Fretibacterium sp. OH1220_COT-178 TaxID=2491047 RepID=UPI000F600F0F|nr:flagellar biosynthesis protein FlhA [Fretibacterium sp. OH1220_COT-178]MDO4785395.1 flagellar biosynthesis protein FlhA [Fretibacterium sp.]RRD63506.1 flagellar biosynthesis protein FlhA [Fretibacterium sp. OH1220_COT-178]